MCIAIVSTAHPKYPLILLNNRDEYLHRPTDVARWWPEPDSQILGGRDLHRKEHGTWLGITKQGRLAVLTNYKEENSLIVEGRRSRGAMVNAYLRVPPESQDSSKTIAENLIEEGLSGVGGFSLMFGHLRKPNWQDKSPDAQQQDWQGLAIVSNRSEHVEDVAWLCQGPGEVHALSNSHYGDRSWPKVVDAEKLVRESIQLSAENGEHIDDLISRLLSVLSRDTLPAQTKSESWEKYTYQLRNSIFIRAIGSDHESTEVGGQSPMPNGTTNGHANGLTNGHVNGLLDGHAQVDLATHGKYGTQKQTVLVVEWTGRAHYFERTLFDLKGQAVPIGNGDRKFDFEIEGWDKTVS